MSSATATRRAAVLVGVVLVSALVGWFLVSLLSDGGSAAPGAGPASPASGGAGSARSSDSDKKPGGGTGSGAAGGSGDSDRSGRAGSGAGSGAGAGESPEGGTVVEHRPADAEEPRPPQPGEKGFRLPGLGGRRPPAYLVDQAPEPDRATGAVVAGYPIAYLRVPQRAQVDLSEVSSQGTRVQAVLQATCDCSVADVVAFHDRTLARLGLTGKAAPAAAGATARGYQDENDSATLTVERDAGAVTYTLFSVITAARA